MTKYEQKNRVNSLIDSVCVDATGGSFPQWEVASFPAKKSQAEAYLAGSITIDDAHMIRTETRAFYSLYSSEPTTAQYLDTAARIIATGNQYELLIGKLTGIRRRLHAEIDSMAETEINSWNPDERFYAEFTKSEAV